MLPGSFPRARAAAPPSARRLLLAAVVALVPLGPVAGQEDGASELRLEVRHLPVPGQWGSDRLRTEQLTGGIPGEPGYLLRTSSTLLEALERAENRTEGPLLALLAPELSTVHNSDLPFSTNDGALWASRGWNHRVRAGVMGRWGPLRVVLAPEWVYEENRPFQVVPYPPGADDPRDFFAHPFHPLPESMDYPIRFGRDSRDRIEPGQSSVTLSVGGAAFGVSSESQWWGPGLKNGILLSSQGPGVPHLFLRTARPLETPLGTVEARWMLGRLDESDFFDRDPENDRRTLSGVVVALQPPGVPELTLGFGRLVMRRLPDGETGLGHALGVFTSVGRPNSRGPELDPGDEDQIFSLFGRWLFPGAGVEVWGEWARFEEPASFRDFLETPNHTQGYTVGLQWARAAGAEGRFRIQGEHTMLEPTATFRIRRVFTSYTSRAVPHGFTHDGQMLGAAIGPGASSQWIALDYLRPDWEIGTFGGRIRWDNGVVLTDVVPVQKREDISVYGGVRAGVGWRGFRLSAELTSAVRLNYLFQATLPDPVSGKTDGVDISNQTFSLTLTRKVGR